VPPRDGDRSSTDTDGELLAQVIPLRRRENELDELQGQPFAPQPADTFDVAPEPSSPLERSVWDQPITELRRRETQSPARASLASRLATRPRPRVYGAHPPRWSIAAAVGITGLAIVALAFGALLQGPPGSRARGAVSSTSEAKLVAGSSTAEGARRRSSPSHPASAARRVPHKSKIQGAQHHRERAGQPATTHTASSSALPSSSATGASATLESAPAHPQSSPSPHDSVPSASQNQCVPGELGC
jgi:hypothetical protein